MSRKLLFVLTVAILCTAVRTATLAQDAGSGDPFFITFDETGLNNYIMADGTTGVARWFVAPDPTGAVPGPVLIFQLPEVVTSGDQVFYEPGTGVGGVPPEVSDVFRFTNQHGDLNGTMEADWMIFYSDLPEPNEPFVPADSGVPTSFVNAGFSWETVNGLGWEVCIKDFGFPNDNKYYGISETPEPSTSAFVVGMLFCSTMAFRRRRR